MTTKMRGPFVNLNGASRSSLISQSMNVASAAENLIKALGLAAPHGRDYQTVSGDKFQDDRMLWEAYLQQVRDIYEEYKATAERLHMEGKR